MRFTTAIGLLSGIGYAVAAPSTSCSEAPTSSSTGLPIVDLGYQIQQASGFNDTGRYYNFSNIRFAAPPVGNLRFAAPAAPQNNRSVVQNGQDTRICPQAAPAWEEIAAKFIPEYVLGQRKFNDSSFTTTSSSNGSLPAQDPTTNEDCLFLDVFVPESIWNQRGSGKKFPVMFWIYGGGYTFGSKTSSGSPSGLLARSTNDSHSGIIYVATNYRLGAFGWLSGPSFQSQGGIANAGLYDQRFALEWVNKYIHLFGGDKDHVTIFGESAGGGSVMHQLSAYGGGGDPVPFRQVISQSPGFEVIVSANQQETIYQNFINTLGVKSLAEARALPYLAVQTANIKTVGASPYGTYTYGPVVDGIFTPSIPGQLFARGQFHKGPRVMVGQNHDEGLLFTSPFLANDDANSTLLRETLVTNIPTLRGLPGQVDYILNTLYPASNYSDQIARSAQITAEFAFICNTRYMDKAKGNETYSYEFDIPPALHGQDVPYTYYTGVGQTSGSVSAPNVALEMQDYFTSFAEFGTPNMNNGSGVPVFHLYGPDARVELLQASGVSEVMDPAANARCDYWQSGVWY